LLAVAGGAGLALVAAACGGGSSDSAARSTRPRSQPTTPPTTAPTTGTSGAATGGAPVPVQCVLTPELTEGPYYLTGEPERRDVTEG